MSSPASAVLRTEFRLFLREPGALFWIMIFPTVLVVILGFIPSFREPVDEFGGQSVLALYIPIAVLLSVIFASLQALPTVLANYREQKILRRIATTPARPSHILGAQYALHAGAILLGAFLVMAIGRIVYGIALPAAPLAYASMLALAVAVCMGLGGVIGGLAPNARMATAIGTLSIFPFMFTAGTWIPVQAMPQTLARIVEFTPLGAAVRGMDAATLGLWPEIGHVATVLAWTVAFGLLAARSFRWE